MQEQRIQEVRAWCLCSAQMQQPVHVQAAMQGTVDAAQKKGISLRSFIERPQSSYTCQSAL